VAFNILCNSSFAPLWIPAGVYPAIDAGPE